MASKRAYPLGEVDDFTRSVRVVASTRNPVNGVRLNGDDEPEPRLEILESWNLERFLKNNVVLWQHDDKSPAIGFGTDVRETDAGLELTIEFAKAADSPAAEEAFRQVRAGLVRGVSVGFDYGEETEEERDGVAVSVFRGNVLAEVSLVTVPADEGAVIPAPEEITDEERAKRRASRAASDLAKHGASLRLRYPRPVPEARTDDNDDANARPPASVALLDVDRLDYSSRLDKFERTQVGGLRIPARIARTGILVYKNSDGTERRELRLAEECFKADSLATLAHAPVTDIEHHRSLISAANWKQAALGHVDNVRRDGDFLVADVLLNDASAIAAVEAGALLDISAGYRCRLEWTSGVHNGERYDAIQRDIKYNHVAVLPPGRGRAGADVGLRLDSIDEEESTHMATEKTERTVIKLDGKSFEYGSQEHVGYLESRLDAKDGEVKQAAKERDEAQARLDAAEAKAKKEKADTEANAEKEKEERAKRAKNARALRKLARNAIRALEDATEEEDDEEKRTDAIDRLEDSLDDMTDREVMERVCRADSKDFDAKAKGRGDEYVAAWFDRAIGNAEEKRAAKLATRTDGVDDVVRKIEASKRNAPAPAKDEETEARDAMVQRGRDAYKQPIGVRAG